MSDLLYGIHPVYEALVAGRRKFKTLYISKNRKTKVIETLLEKARSQGVPIQYKEPDYFRSHLGSSVHQGVAAEVRGLPLVDEGTILKKAETESELPLILALDGIVDPQNLGSIIRTALAMGVHGIILPKARSAPLSPAVSKASAGAMEHILIARVSNLVAALKGLKKAGLWVMGTAVRSGKRLDEADLNTGLVIVIGGEDQGIRPLVQKTCDYLVCIPQMKAIDSLNASVAAAIVLYEIGRQRKTYQV
ncbi:MAG: 23S rRNA (guanosine(2251)-2'-O)-methyltransferase RlmB [Deltaproteobacteria bacterium]|nr:MAG: 23S rRNA (guanosine(2251)-2'-O)-methyltransferase RlmB [Deltaproteobacteria bacterium]